MKITQLYSNARRRLLTQEDPQTAGRVARELLSHVTATSVEATIANAEHYVSDDICQAMDQAVSRYLNGEPLAYILGCWDFYGMELIVDQNVLIPRDDTCAVTDLAIKAAKMQQGSVRVLDLCTGSGCIGLAVASNVKNAKVTLADVSTEALSIAKKNTAKQKLSANVTCLQVDALKKPESFLGKFDVIVSNPPYITTQEMLALPESVKDYEPHLALYGGDDGLCFYRAIAENFRSAIKDGGYLCFEFGMGQGDDVCAILEENGYTILERSSDYNQIERAVLARLDRKEEKYGY